MIEFKILFYNHDGILAPNQSKLLLFIFIIQIIKYLDEGDLKDLSNYDSKEWFSKYKKKDEDIIPFLYSYNPKIKKLETKIKLENSNLSKVKIF